MDLISLREKCIPSSPCTFAVAVPLIKRTDGWYLLYEVRAASLRRQGGEVCFPGGKAEPGEDAVACAVRELQEELRIVPTEVLGALPFSMATRGGIICPVLLAIPDAIPMANPEEVADTFSVSLTYLREHPPAYYSRENLPHALVGIPENYTWWSPYHTVPVYTGLPHPLWGVTARITDQFLKMI